MRYLFKLWYENQKQAEETYQRRFNSDVAVHTGLRIRPMNVATSFELYYLPTNTMMCKLAEVEEKDRRLRDYENLLPKMAQHAFFISCLAEELESTNVIEGVESSRADIAESAKAIQAQQKPSKSRLASMIGAYVGLTTTNLGLPKRAEHIRKFYDLITAGEIATSDLPDGEVFIKEGAEVHKGVIGKVLHRGIGSEESIIKHMNELLSFLNREHAPLLIRLAIAHYYFGYVHPFYDGNGRTSRFMTSLYLSQTYSVSTAFCLSIGCRIKHKTYLDLFDRTNKFNAYGELNYAIDAFLDILIAGQNQLLETIEESKALFDSAIRRIEGDKQLDGKELAKDLLCVLAQVYFFSVDAKEMTRQELLELFSGGGVGSMKASARKVQGALEELMEHGYIRQTKKRPLSYVLSGSITIF